MASESSIEIFQRTLLKLLIRRGTNEERLGAILSVGELGFTTDTNKLYAGDGSTYGGIQVTGSKFLGAAGDITTLAPADINDIAFDTSTNTLYFISTGTGITLDEWTKVGAVITNTDGTISVDGLNRVSLGDISGQSITKDANNKITLADTIYTDTVIKKNNPATTYFGMPSRTSFGSINYSFPSTAPANTYLRVNAGGVLTWSGLASTATSFVNSEIMPVGTILPYGDVVLPSSNRFLRCDGSYVLGTSYPVLSAVLGITFGALSTVGPSIYFKLPDLRGRAPVGYTTSGVSDLSGNSRTLALGVTDGMFQAAYGTLTGDRTITTNPYVSTNYIIKAIADPIANCGFTLFDSISATRDGVPTSTINPLSGTYVLGLNTVLSGASLGYMTVNNKGLVTDYDDTSAGSVGNILPSGANSEHDFAFINFLRQQETVVSDTIFGVVPNTWGPEKIEVFPVMKDIEGNTVSPGTNIPRQAKNVIISVRLTAASNSTSCLFCAASTEGRLGSGNSIDATEFAVYKDAGDSNQTVGQFIIPLTWDGSTLSFAMRGNDASNAGFSCRVIGWTL